MKFLDLFAGIGGFHSGMEKAGHKCVGYVEIDKFARASYQAIYKTEGLYTANDIRTIRASELPKADIWCFGFPCQDISVAGKQEGFAGARSSLFFATTRIIRDLKQEDRPSYLVIENVKNLLSINAGFDFLKLQIELDEIGYDCEWDVLDTAEVLPQHRERVYIVGHFRGRGTRKVFPIRREGQNSAKGKEINIKPKIKRAFDARKNGTYGSQDVVYPNGISNTLNTMTGGNREPKIAIPCLTPDRVKKRQNGRRFKNNGEPAFTLNTQDRNGILIKEATNKGYKEAHIGDAINISQPNSKTRRGRVGYKKANTLTTGEEQATLTKDMRIRKLTPLECWRLQGFTDEQFHKAEKVNSNSQLYKQAGNSVSVPVVYAIAEKLEFKGVTS
ncbi:DNA (cytosine-5-)-methyltransferase [Liquorilactobacillus mali]|uniref:DNA (cytosine-5-)-methyltransferase n=1 Tax=Liquorilactobacillus mali TaxID=1618 RepID=UPI002955863E|nr:DNA (cytosine-5-)-methyltransferase [Liquorilactobacillus mali]MDV7758240.1 DNA (cytosine-5-)-methyltransferase [Liquorilactobacillus mali]